jgi:Uncharacterized anaerobic dehydrogenase
LRGHASIQGSTDIPTLYDILPGYLSMPKGDGTEETLRDYLAHQTKPTGLWNNYPSYFISLMKAYYGRTRRRKTTSATIGFRRSRGTIRSSNMFPTWLTEKWKACL